MFEDAFIKLERAEAEAVLKDVNPALQGSPFSADTATILSHPLPFYPGWDFLEVADHSQVPIKKRQVLHKKGAAIILDGTNAPFYDLNRKAAIHLDAETVPLYVRFFFSHVRGRHGRFIIVETVDDIAWRDDPPVAARKAVGQLLQALEVRAANDDGSYELTARLMFRDALFRSDIHVSADGMVTLANEEMLVEDMPVLDDTFGL